MNKSLLLILLLIPLTSAINVSLDYPHEVFYNKEFNVTVSTDSIQLYDVKIDIFSEENRISKIFDKKWKSTMYYVDTSLKYNKTYNLIVPEYVGKAKITLKLRNYADKIKTFTGYNISIIEPIVPIQNESIENNSDDSDDDEIEEDEKPKVIKEKPAEKKQKKEIKNEEIIYLNPQTIKTDKNNSFIDSGYSKYTIILFCIILAILYVIKPKKKKNEFE